MILATLPGDPIGAPRMNRADSWQKRPCVLRYRAWHNAAANVFIAAKVGECPIEVRAVAWFPMPASWSKTKRQRMTGQPMRSKPDADNVLKSILDLWKQDSGVARASIEKRWTDGAGRVELALYFEGEEAA